MNLTNKEKIKILEQMQIELERHLTICRFPGENEIPKMSLGLCSYFKKAMERIYPTRIMLPGTMTYHIPELLIYKPNEYKRYWWWVFDHNSRRNAIKETIDKLNEQ